MVFSTEFFIIINLFGFYTFTYTQIQFHTYKLQKSSRQETKIQDRVQRMVFSKHVVEEKEKSGGSKFLLVRTKRREMVKDFHLSFYTCSSSPVTVLK